MLAELLRAEVKYAGVVEAALGEKAQHLVAASSQAVLEDGAELAKLPGRVWIICLDRLGEFTNGYDFAQHREVRGRAIDMVSNAPDCEPLAWHLLGKTVVVDTIDAAIRLAQVAPPGYRWVSVDGDVLEADGALQLGRQTGPVGLISRKSELRQLAHSLRETDERIVALGNETEQHASRAGHLEKNLQELRTAIYETTTERIETESRRGQIDRDLNRLKQEQPIIASELTILEEQIQEAMTLQESSRQSLVDLDSINQQRQEQMSKLATVISSLESHEEALLEQITELKVAAGQGEQKRLALREKIRSSQVQLQQCRGNIEMLTGEVENAQRNRELSERAILATEGRICELFQKRQQLQQRNAQARSQRQGLADEQEELTELARWQEDERAQLQEKLHAAQMHLNEARVRVENVLARAQEELQEDLADRYRSLQQGIDEGQATDVGGADAAAGLGEQVDWDAMAAEIADLRRKIGQLGNVNLDAISEQEELEQRQKYLSDQRQDLTDSRGQLERLITKINRESEARFRENFEAIRENFAELFRKLFGGGRAEIILEDPDDILECGIEIVARPPGKQLQSISLLSGGEKTLTAVALLLGIFKSKPCPFCLLDEVDAALDEANIERFTLLLNEFLSASQFLIITHSRRTMSIADAVYGITMQEQGVSKKVSVRFGDEEETDSDSAVA